MATGLLSLVEGYSAGMVALLCVIGFVLVIAVLIVLIVLLTLFSKAFGALEKASERSKENHKKVVKEDVSTTAESGEDEEVVAAITAALLAFYDVNAVNGEEKVRPPFIIRSIKKQ